MEPLGQNYPLRAEYDLNSLRWLLAKAGEARRYGPLRSVIVRDESGRAAGCYVYYVKRGEVAQVLRLEARPETFDALMDCLARDAWERGAAAISGAMQPRFISELSNKRCRFACPGLGVLVQSRDRELLETIHRGEALLTRLDGEWWMRFGIDKAKGW
jgi:hypothetical protein